jgi:hypothetical protein
MKTKLFTLLLTAALSLGFLSQAQAQQNVLKINPLSLALLTGNVQYERALNEAMSVQLGVFYTGFSTEIEGIRLGYSGVGITPEFRYYVSNARQDAPRGVYLGPYVRYRNISTSAGDDVDEGAWESNLIGGGLILGHQWLFGDAFVLDMFIGPGFRSTNTRVVSTSGTITQDDLLGLGSSGTGVLFRWGLSIGAAF